MKAPRALSTLDRIRQMFDEAGIEYRELHHRPTRTSEDSARVRGEDLRTGGKALLMKVGGEFKLFVLSAALRMDSQAIRKYFDTRKTRFASTEELHPLEAVFGQERAVRSIEFALGMKAPGYNLYELFLCHPITIVFYAYDIESGTTC